MIEQEEDQMKNLVLAFIALSSLGAGSAFAVCGVPNAACVRHNYPTTGACIQKVGGCFSPYACEQYNCDGSQSSRENVAASEAAAAKEAQTENSDQTDDSS